MCINGVPDFLAKLMPEGYEPCPECWGTGTVAQIDDLNDMDTIRFEICPVCNGNGFIKEDKT